MSWKPKAAAAYQLKLVRMERAVGRSQEAGGLALALLDGAWSTPEAFRSALCEHLGWTPDEADDARLLVTTLDEPEDEACSRCGLVLELSEERIPYALTKLGASS